MATDPRARYVSLPFSINDRTHGLRMTLGTALALGINPEQIGTGYVNRTVQGGARSRRLYPGGPSVSYSVPTGERPVAVGPGSGRARTNRKLIVRDVATNSSATIYFSGRQADAVAWLRQNATIADDDTVGGFQLYSATGKPLTVAYAPA